MLCYRFPWPWVPSCNAKVSSWLKPLLHLVDQITFCVFSHTAEQDSQPIVALISKQAIPYRTHLDTYCPRGCTPKTQSLADSRMINHFTWQIPTVCTIPTHAQTTTSILTRSTHISTDGRPTLSTLTQAKLNIIKMEDLYNTHDYRARQI
jgi:hypothetical protein